ncbi:MAG: amidohydrolase, partial [Lachnospiraceae bacterium]|nr:amidohydrolase [Lachnospiraceae bacterium]
MNIRLYNARILTMKHKELIDGEIWVRDERILYVGDGTDTDAVYRKLELHSIVMDREIDCES